jgi:hypothetical protein
MTFMDFADQRSMVSPVVSDAGWVAIAIIFHRSSIGSLLRELSVNPKSGGST